MSSAEQQQQQQQPDNQLIDLTDMEDDDLVPESLRNLVADMDNLLQTEQRKFLSVASVDPVIDSTGQNNKNDVTMSPDLLTSPGLNPAANIRRQPGDSTTIFTPKPSLFGQQPNSTAAVENSALIDFATTNFSSPPPPSYETSLSMADHSRPVNSLPPRPPSPPPKTTSSLRVAKLEQMEVITPPQDNEDPFAALMNGAAVKEVKEPPAVPAADASADPFASGSPPAPNASAANRASTSSFEKAAAESSMMSNPLVSSAAPNSTANGALSSTGPHTAQKAAATDDPDPFASTVSNTMVSSRGSNHPSTNTAPQVKAPNSAPKLGQSVSQQTKPTNGGVSKPLQVQNLDTLLANDAAKYDLPPPTPASTITGPQPLAPSTPPRQAPSAQPETPSPLSMSSMTREAPKEVQQRKDATTPKAPQPSPPPPRFSPSPIEKVSSQDHRLSDDSKSSSRRDALSKKIAMAKKSPDKSRTFAQRLFATVDKIARVAPAPTNNIGELKTKPVTTTQMPSKPVEQNLGELKTKPAVERKPENRTTKARSPAVVSNNQSRESPRNPANTTTAPIAVDPPKASETAPEKRVECAAKEVEPMAAMSPKQPEAPMPPVKMKPKAEPSVVKAESMATSPTKHLDRLKRNEPAKGHFMMETAVSAAKVAPTVDKEIHVHHVKPLDSTSHLLKPTSSTEAHKHKHNDEVGESFEHKVVSPEKVRPLDPSSHLLQSTSSIEAKKIVHLDKPPEPRSSPQKVKKLPANSHLLQATVAAEARKTERKIRTLPPPPPRRVVTGASERLMKQTNASKKKIEEGVAKAKERIRLRKLQEQGGTMNQTHSANSSRTSTSSKRSLTVPKSPKFATKSRHPPDPVPKDQSLLHNSLAECDSMFGKSLRSSDAQSVGTSSTSRRPKDLTIPISPRFSTDARRGSKSKPSESHNAEITLAHSAKVLQQSLRSVTVPPPNRKTRQGLTRGVSPKFSTISRRELPKSTEERELEAMKEFQQKTPFRARPYPGITNRPRTNGPGETPSFMKPTQTLIARQTTSTTPKNGASSFRARPIPRSTFQAPKPKPNIHSPTTTMRPFEFQTSTRGGGRHTAMTEAARKRAEAKALERQAMNAKKEADEVDAIRRKHALELKREQEKRNRLVAKLSPHNIPSDHKKRMTNPQPFHLASTSRHESAREELLRKQAEEEALRRKQASFRAKPVPKTTYEARPIGSSPVDARPKHTNEENRSSKVAPIETVFCDSKDFSS